MRPFVILAVFLVLAAMAASPVTAGRYAVSKSPHWAVGQLDARLSSACQGRRFNQLQRERIYISFQGPRGTAVMGVAAKGFNLYDPQGLAQPDVHYHFFNDGYSDCRVYWAPVR